MVQGLISTNLGIVFWKLLSFDNRQNEYVSKQAEEYEQHIEGDGNNQWINRPVNWPVNFENKAS